ncbi:MAG: pyridoxamine 5'-phosphate oxidase family protein [Candidatus Omnitrophica bacterium]|nr:pyridoxamine 5'-phosphate oxidase family protein [Candidatus Omnitrophota bacterium]HOX54264.1 pyridoxamine 5'-phosphate oxidase family protein [Candidatus Omnitrophota bacterium]
MQEFSEEIIHFFQIQGFVIVSTLDEDGSIHNSCKGIVKIESKGQVYLFDLYKARTFQNLQSNPTISLTAVEEHKFQGYCLKGKGKIVETEDLKPEIVALWDDKITARATKRMIKNIHEEKGHPAHPEILLPKPEYLIVVEVEEIINLTPGKMR